VCRRTPKWLTQLPDHGRRRRSSVDLNKIIADHATTSFMLLKDAPPEVQNDFNSVEIPNAKIAVLIFGDLVAGLREISVLTLTSRST